MTKKKKKDDIPFMDKPLGGFQKLNGGATKCKNCGKCCRENPCSFATFDLKVLNDSGGAVCDNLFESGDDDGKFYCMIALNIVLHEPFKTWDKYPAFGTGCPFIANDSVRMFAQGMFDKLTYDQKKAFMEYNSDWDKNNTQETNP